MILADSTPLIDPIGDDYDALSFGYNAKSDNFFFIWRIHKNICQICLGNRVNRIRKRLPAANESNKGFDISPEIRINENA